MEQDNIYNELKKMLAHTDGKYNILEEQIDIELQLDFFELVNELMKEGGDKSNVTNMEKNLYEAISTEDKKRILANLSLSENPQAYRIIERFKASEDETLDSWATLALQHSRISLETHLLDEQQVFISTGLGGKHEKLRYFIVCKLISGDCFSEVQMKMVNSEFGHVFTNQKSVVEKISFTDNYFTVLALIPIDIPINQVIESAIKEANNYGGFLHDKFLVTNVKMLTKEEIKGYFKKKKI